jgi:RNA polymerase sigma factor (sigma-70 family)
MEMSVQSAALSDEELLARYLSGREARVFGELVRRLSPLVYATALRITRSAADAADVAQDCFLQLAKLREPTARSISCYLYTMTRNRSLDLLRSKRRRRQREGMALPVERRSPEELELLANLDSAVDQLPEEHRDLVVRHFLRGESQVELAACLQVSQGTVSRRIQGSLEALREQLAQAGVGASALGALPAMLQLQERIVVPEELVQRLGRPGGRPMVAKGLGALAGLGVAAAIAIAVYSATRPATGLVSGSLKEDAVMTSVAPGRMDNVIRNAPPLKGQIGQQCTHIGSMQAALAMMGEDISYNELMGASGAAFRLCFCQPRWDYSSVDGMLSYDHAAVAMKALGYSQAKISGSGNPQEPAGREIRAAICREIDAGRPALGIDLVVCPEWSVIAGYEDGGKTLLCRSYFDDDPKLSKTPEGYVRSDRWPWIRVLFGPKGEGPSARENLRAAIKVAVTFSKDDEYIISGGGARYARGLTAYAVWANDLEDEARFGTREEILHHWGVNCSCYDALLDARLAAAEYLRRHVAEADAEARPEIGAAAEQYGRIAELLQKGRQTFVPIYSEGRDAKEWTREQRARQAMLLRECQGLEQTALEHLARASERMR